MNKSEPSGYSRERLWAYGLVSGLLLLMCGSSVWADDWQYVGEIEGVDMGKKSMHQYYVDADSIQTLGNGHKSYRYVFVTGALDRGYEREKIDCANGMVQAMAMGSVPSWDEAYFEGFDLDYDPKVVDVKTTPKIHWLSFKGTQTRWKKPKQTLVSSYVCGKK